MKLKKRTLAAAVMIAVSGLANASAVKLDQLKVRDSLYPENFKEELQANLNFYIDGVGVDKDAVVPYDPIWLNHGKFQHGNYTNTTEIGLYLNILVEVEKAGNPKALVRIAEVLKQLEQAPKFKGMFYWPYNISHGRLSPNKDKIVPSVDNSNLDLALTGVAGAYIDSKDPKKQDIVKRIDALLAGQKKGWSELYDPHKGWLKAGWQKGKLMAHYVGRKSNETRLGPLWASLITRDMGKDAVPASAFETLELYTTSYSVKGTTYKPILSWDGAYFQAMLPAIWLNEKSLVPDYRMFEDLTKLQMIYAKKYNIPMVSSSSTVTNSYTPFGIPFLSESNARFKNNVHSGTTGTPHATALSYMVNKEASLTALKDLKKAYPKIESTAGWFDAVDSKGRMATKLLSLDQGMFVGSFLAESINKDVQRYMEAKHYWKEVQVMYQSFIPTEEIKSKSKVKL
ncbi:hypothetical protein [Endozoicomonas sp. Mp262]|uniref:hypothetical protein n=1 Tax=Endozoicomonas sp. Mp262 TaxID=2919499 RepID=UPI0021D84736